MKDDIAGRIKSMGYSSEALKSAYRDTDTALASAIKPQATAPARSPARSNPSQRLRQASRKRPDVRRVRDITPSAAFSSRHTAPSKFTAQNILLSIGLSMTDIVRAIAALF